MRISDAKAVFSIVLLIGLTACSEGNRFADIDEFVGRIAAQPKGQIAPMPEFQPYQAFTYNSSNRRSPFEPPVIIPVKTKQQVANLNIKPPANHVREYLERFKLGSLTMVGTLAQDGIQWALLQDGSGGVHRVKPGDFLGTDWGEIREITNTRIDVVEVVTDGADGWLERPRFIELKGE